MLLHFLAVITHSQHSNSYNQKAFINQFFYWKLWPKSSCCY